ncbi:MAG: hypothetical protein ABSF53_07425 [Terracidiphilus sp.]|jgi:hypothetical protein
MNKYARTVVAIAFFLGLAGAVKVQAEEADIVTVPFEFVVGAKTLPAGTYTVRSLSVDKSGALELSSQDYKNSMFVLPQLDESVFTGKPELSFQHVGDHYFLNTIQTTATIYRIHVPVSSMSETAMKTNDGAFASGSHGGK